MTKTKVALFGSFYRGYYLLNELLYGPLRTQIEVVGVATDQPDQSYISAHKRVWQYPHSLAEEKMVAELAQRHGIDVYTGRVKQELFYENFEKNWKPHICLMGTFGQKIDDRLFNFPPLGFFNFHPTDGASWPSRYAGSNPFRELLDDGASHCVICMHRVDSDFDNGELIKKSEPIAIPPDSSVVDLHKITSPMAALLAREELRGILSFVDSSSTG